MAKKLKVVVVPVGKDAYVTDIDNTLEAMQELVEGYIEVVRFTEAGEMFDGTKIVCNDEGFCRNMKANKLGIRGPFFIISDRIEGDGEMVGLTEAHAKVLASLLNSNGG